MISYVVEHVNKPGGIQEFAKALSSELRKEYTIGIVNWQPNTLISLLDGLSIRLPSAMGYFSYQQLEKPILTHNYAQLNEAHLIHFWTLKPALPFLNKHYLVSCHGRELLEKNMRGFERNAYKRALSNARAIHVNSHFTANLLSKFCGFESEKIEIIYPCLPFDTFECGEKNFNKQIVIGTLTRFNRRKNVLTIIKALNILKERFGVNFEYYLAGDGIEKEQILNALRSAKFKWHYFGVISDTFKMKFFYPNLDIFVMPTLNLPDDIEGFGIVYVEANAFGVPVVASRTGGVVEAVKENVSGAFANPTEPEDIAIKIVDLLEKRKEYVVSCKEWALKFSRPKIAEAFRALYDKIW